MYVTAMEIKTCNGIQEMTHPRTIRITVTTVMYEILEGHENLPTQSCISRKVTQ